MEQQLVIYLVVLSRGHVDVEVDALYRDRYTTVPFTCMVLICLASDPFLTLGTEAERPSRCSHACAEHQPSPKVLADIR